MAHGKNCYLVRSSVEVQDGFYSCSMYKSKDFCDCDHSQNLELCYEIFNSKNCFETFWSTNIKNTQNSALLFDCENVKNCLCCIGLRYKEYYFLNEKMSPSDFKNIWNKFLQNSEFRKDCFLKFQKALKNHPRRSNLIIQSENCVGDDIMNSKNAFMCFHVDKFEDVKFGEAGTTSKDSYDISQPDFHELSYETSSCLKAYNCHFCFNAIELINCDYCETSSHLENCFGCVGLKKAQYCIFNKQYTKEEYFTLREKIIDQMKKTVEWGEFFPIELSPFGYNETLAQEYFPLTKKEVLNKGWQWKDDEISTKYTGPKYQIYNSISETPDDILQAILECEECGKNYRIIKAELNFYRKMNLPVPHKCPNCRHKNRLALRNPRQLFDRKCDNCGKDIHTTFAPNRPEKVFCEECYLKAIN